ncbi:uncharacterized protein F5Z01DRAFT_523726 [Emericellopsis atlantica]|uniref:Uncharacterized protein n=1 Tax=Emericellopsis atlantica TaxID=2614577 RepID=A0A9P7ZQQ3_9HYPO|nr:uncharacterized protein F5Z01DRAFT_523726 [Emericellopsis atlantica]KAG9255903.1 hypothetical protein F5Z01DRAFT_523726 [Emericellopsis atlantica]
MGQPPVPAFRRRTGSSQGPCPFVVDVPCDEQSPGALITVYARQNSQQIITTSTSLRLPTRHCSSVAIHTYSAIAMADTTTQRAPVKRALKPAPKPVSYTHQPRLRSEVHFVLAGVSSESNATHVKTAAIPQPFLEPHLLTSELPQ